MVTPLSPDSPRLAPAPASFRLPRRLVLAESKMFALSEWDPKPQVLFAPGSWYKSFDPGPIAPGSEPPGE
jgi:hypothetical protein